MSSFIYLYSKFTEELLLLSSAAIFTLLAVYCYEWVIKKRRLGAARDQIPANMVKIYLNQLIQEAQGVRTQLFGLMNSNLPEGQLPSLDLSQLLSAPHAAEGAASRLVEGAASRLAESAAISPDLEARLKALQSQLTEKESIVVNINIEKTKLLEEIENLRQNQKAMSSLGKSAGNGDELLKKVKELEARLEEYSLFEDDLANLKRLQQENLLLKKKLEDLGSGLTSAPKPVSAPVSTPIPTPVSSPVSAPAASAQPEPVNAAPAAYEPAPAAISSSGQIDQRAIDALLEGIPATPPEKAAPVDLPSAGSDEFENLVNSVDSSLGSKPEASPAPAPVATLAPAPAAPVAPAPEAPAMTASAPTEPGGNEALAAKSDEELLKEFENLLNS